MVLSEHQTISQFYEGCFGVGAESNPNPGIAGSSGKSKNSGGNPRTYFPRRAYYKWFFTGNDFWLVASIPLFSGWVTMIGESKKHQRLTGPPEGFRYGFCLMPYSVCFKTVEHGVGQKKKLLSSMRKSRPPRKRNGKKKNGFHDP